MAVLYPSPCPITKPSSSPGFHFLTQIPKTQSFPLNNIHPKALSSAHSTLNPKDSLFTLPKRRSGRNNDPKTQELKLNDAFLDLEYMVGKGHKPDVPNTTQLLHDLCKCNELRKAARLMEMMVKSGSVPDPTSYTFLVNSLCRRGDFGHTTSYMEEYGFPSDTMTYNYLLRGLCRRGNLKETLRFFEKSTRKGLIPDAFTYSTLVQAAYEERGIDEAVRLLGGIISAGGDPDLMSYNVILTGLCGEGRVEDAVRLLRSLRCHSLQSVYKVQAYKFLMCVSGWHTQSYRLQILSPVPLNFYQASVCLTCGDKGNTSLLIYCRKCRDSAVHHYCMNNISPNDDNIDWWCWDCAPTDSISEPLRKSGRSCLKQQMFLKTRNSWKGRRLNQNKRLVQTSDEVNEIGQAASARHSPTRDVESQLSNERRRDVDILEEKGSMSEIPSHCKEHHESTAINEPSLGTKCILPLQEENNIKPYAGTQKIQEDGKKRRILGSNDSNPKDEGNTIDQVPSLVVNDHWEPSLEPDDNITAEPVIDPKWRGWFNLKEEDEETCVEILAHLSNKACSKVCDAATTMPYMLDIQVLDKHVVWPKSFSVSPPTAASIALYFFPACDRDERIYDILLDDVIERELALKAMINNVELLIFSSYELPLQYRRFNSKYFFWGVFRQKQSSHLSAESATARRQNNSEMENYGHREPTNGAKDNDLVL